MGDQDHLHYLLYFHHVQCLNTLINGTRDSVYSRHNEYDSLLNNLLHSIFSIFVEVEQINGRSSLLQFILHY